MVFLKIILAVWKIFGEPFWVVEDVAGSRVELFTIPEGANTVVFFTDEPRSFAARMVCMVQEPY